jgi:hypothetical protein
MSKEIARYTFHVSSDKRSSGTATDLTLALVNTISIKSKRGKFMVVVHTSNVPFSFYQLSSDINTLQCVFVNSGQSKTANIQLATGNYTTISVLAELSSKLISEAQISSGSYVGFTPVLNFTYSQTTSKSTFTYTGPANTSIQMNFASNTNLGIFFGLSANTLISQAGPVTSTKVAVANPVNYLLIRSGNLQQIYNREYVVESDVFSDILHRVPVGTQQNTWIQHQGDSDPVFISNNLITSINIYLTTNLTYTPIDLQGIGWAISFSLVEIEIPEYEQINTISNFQTITPVQPVQPGEAPVETPTPTPEEEELQKQYEEELKKLEVYKNKLLKRKLK